MQGMEDDLVESHKSSIEDMDRWIKKDSALLRMTNEVDFDQDGKNLEL